MKREEYFDYKAISRSLLVALKDHPKKAKKLMEYGSNEESEALLMGDAFDTLRFDGEEVFNEKFHVMQMENPFPDNRSYVGKLMSASLKYIEQPSIGFDEMIDLVFAAYEGEVQNKTSDYEKICKEFTAGGGFNYLVEVRDAEGRKILTKDQHNQLVKMKYQVLDNQFVNRYFVENPIRDAESYHENNCDLFYQKAILWEEKGVECKALLDIIEVDHTHKTITPIDLKTTFTSDHNFDGSMLKWDYVHQAGFYMMGVTKWRDINYPDYNIKNFRFVFVDKNCNFEPAIYQVSDKDLNISIWGGRTKSGYLVRGMMGLIEDLKWHMTHDLWEYRKEVYESNGVIISDLYDNVDVYEMMRD